MELSKRSYTNMKDCDPRLKQIAFRAIEITPIDFGIPTDGGMRTSERQNALFLIVRSKCDGYIKKSRHQIKDGYTWARALDFYAYENGEANWDKHSLAVIAAAFLQAACELGYIIEWGGLWKWKDYPHIQLAELEN